MTPRLHTTGPPSPFRSKRSKSRIDIDQDRRVVTAIYIRVSSVQQVIFGNSLEAQAELLLKFCEATGRTVFRVYEDRGISGKSAENRPGLQRLICDAREGHFNEVLVWKISRLARNNLEFLTLTEEWKGLGIFFHSYSEQLDMSTFQGKMMASIMGTLNEMERESILENAELGIHQRVSEGGHMSKPPIGYRLRSNQTSGRKQAGTVEIEPTEAALVQRMFQQFASGHGYRYIANGLNRSGYRTKKGNPFSTCAVKDILDNPFYIGKIRYGRFINWNEQRRKGKNDEPVIADGQHPPIIEQALWDKVQFLRQKKSHLSVKKYQGDFLLTGLLRCPQCGSAMTASRTNNKDKNGNLVIRLYYSCSAMRSKGSSVCSANSVRKAEAEQYVFDRLKEVIDKPHILRGILQNVNARRKGGSGSLRQELITLTAKLEDNSVKRQRYMELFETEDFDKEMFSRRLNELEEEFSELDYRRVQLVRELERSGGEPIDYDTLRTLIGHLEGLLRLSDTEQRKTLLRMMVKKITIGPDKRIDRIELAFDEESQEHFLNAAPSGVNAPEGAFSLKGGETLKGGVTVVI
ncbi:recombinase family protein [Paenibacillus rhizophilus]|uniref:Recombinase family protein n=1 Tax=Paenibacillus rhizophilus TaxID=1850366 RepID=A0A3N9NYY6_9BACL|nr:recombinase family protein [Paenibacillus rhizophilus]RQW08855.1 recombinase family protein [Paenibacillus rhizophilus]